MAQSNIASFSKLTLQTVRAALLHHRLRVVVSMVLLTWPSADTFVYWTWAALVHLGWTWSSKQTLQPYSAMIMK